MSLNILFWVQHLLGIGHVKRAASISRALSADGHRVTVAQGGSPVAGVDWGHATLQQLPALASDPGFSRLFDPVTKQEATERLWGARQQALRHLVSATQPDIILLEGWPLARGKFTQEVEGFLVHAVDQAAPGHRPLIATSLRDILVNKPDPKKADRMVDRAERWCDLLLIHGDPHVAKLEDSFPAAARLAHRFRYTGYVADPKPVVPPPDGAGEGEVLISAGGGAVGASLYEAALDAAGDPRLSDLGFRLLLGPDLPEDKAEVFRQAATVTGDGPVAPGAISVEAARSDFRGLLANAALSVSQAGYNTAMDLMVTGCPAVLVPFGSGGESEQTVRATLWAEAHRATVLKQDELNGASLANAIHDARQKMPARLPVVTSPIDGAAETARLLALSAASMTG